MTHGDLFNLELVLEASRRMLHRHIDAQCEEAIHFINRSGGQRLRYLREGWINNDTIEAFGGQHP